MTDTLTEQPLLEWRSEYSGTPIRQRLTAEGLAKLLRRDGYLKRNARVIDDFTVEATTLDGGGNKTTWIGTLPDTADRRAAAEALLAQWMDGTVSLTQHRRLRGVLLAHVDGLPVGELLDRLLATAGTR